MRVLFFSRRVTTLTVVLLVSSLLHVRSNANPVLVFHSGFRTKPDTSVCLYSGLNIDLCVSAHLRTSVFLGVAFAHSNRERRGLSCVLLFR